MTFTDIQIPAIFKDITRQNLQFLYLKKYLTWSVLSPYLKIYIQSKIKNDLKHILGGDNLNCDMLSFDAHKLAEVAFINSVSSMKKTGEHRSGCVPRIVWWTAQTQTMKQNKEHFFSSADILRKKITATTCFFET